MKKTFLSLAAITARITPVRIKKALYRSPRLSKRIRDGLNMAAPRGFTEVNIAAGSLQGARMSLDMQSEKDYWLGTYEPQLQVAIRDFVKPGMVTYDVGANIGYISLQLGRTVGEGGHVYAFEALPENVERLRVNISLNAMDSIITVIPQAVSNRAARMTFLVGPSGGTGKVSGSAGRQDLAYTQEILVDALSLDSFVYEMGYAPPDVVKMDIEGGELLAIPGMRRVLNEVRPVVMIELHGFDVARVAWEEFRRAGYKIYNMIHGYEEVTRFEELDWKSYLVAQTG